MPSQDQDDAILEEVAALVRVDPTPEFTARVRQRIAAQAIEHRVAPAAWLLIPVTIALVVGIVVGVTLDRPGDIESDVVTQPTPTSAPPERAAAQPQPSSSPSSGEPFVRRREPDTRHNEVLISQDEAKGIDLLMESIRDGRLDAAAVPDFSNVLKPSIEIVSATLEPIRVAPLSEIPPIEGVTP